MKIMKKSESNENNKVTKTMRKKLLKIRIRKSRIKN